MLYFNTNVGATLVRAVRIGTCRPDQRQIEFPRIDSSQIELMSDRCLIKNRTENLMKRRGIEEEVEYGIALRVVEANRRGLRIGPQKESKARSWISWLRQQATVANMPLPC